MRSSNNRVFREILVITLFVSMFLSYQPNVLGQELVWQDDFNGTELDRSKWTPIIGDGCPNLCGFGNNELQFYTEENISLESGTLVMTAKKESIEKSDYSSVKLVSRGKGDWQYGKIVVRAQLPSGRGTWPAIWMLPTLGDVAMRWPDDGEIDIMEHVDYNQGMVYGTIHTKKFNHMVGTQKSDSIFIADAHTTFHEYSVSWDEETMVWAVDDEVYLTLFKGGEGMEGWPFDKKFHLILNLAIGGNWGGSQGVDDQIWPQRFIIDFVKVYQ